MATQDSNSPPTNIQNLIGEKFGRLTVTGYSHRVRRPSDGYYYFWTCLCKCGNGHVVKGRKLKEGGVSSCGCLRVDLATKHGMCNSPEYNSWRAMMDRCRNPDKYYKELDIDVCERWKSFSNFIEDMGEKPSPGHSIDRIDNRRGYFPENCRWATRVQQNNNSRHNRLLTFKGKTLTVAQWARRLGIDAGVLGNRLHSGWTVKRTLTEPLND